MRMTQKELQEIKNTVTKIKNAFESLIGGFKRNEERN